MQGGGDRPPCQAFLVSNDPRNEELLDTKNIACYACFRSRRRTEVPVPVNAPFRDYRGRTESTITRVAKCALIHRKRCVRSSNAGRAWLSEFPGARVFPWAFRLRLSMRAPWQALDSASLATVSHRARRRSQEPFSDSCARLFALCSCGSSCKSPSTTLTRFTPDARTRVCPSKPRSAPYPFGAGRNGAPNGADRFTGGSSPPPETPARILKQR